MTAQKQTDQPFSVRDGRNDEWFKIDNLFYQGGWAAHVGPFGQAVYAALARHANSKTQKSWPSYDTIARETGMSRRKVITVVEELISLNLVRKFQERSKKGSPERGNLYNVYYLVDRSEWIPVVNAPDAPDQDQDDGNESHVTEGEASAQDAPVHAAKQTGAQDAPVHAAKQGGAQETSLVHPVHAGSAQDAPKQDSRNKTQGTRRIEQEAGGPSVPVPAPSVTPKPLAGIWKTCLEELRLQMTSATFTTWLAGSQLVELEGDAAVIAVRDSYAVEWLSSRLYAPIQRTLQGIAGVSRICFITQGEPQPTPPAKAPPVVRVPGAWGKSVDLETGPSDLGTGPSDWEAVNERAFTVREEDLSI